MPGPVRVALPLGPPPRGFVEQIDLWRVRIPMRQGLRSAVAHTTAKDALLVRIRTRDGDGWGECSAQTAPTYAPDTLDTARTVLRDHLAPRVFAGVATDDVRGHRFARAAIEGALVDLHLRAAGVSLATAIGATRDRVPAGITIGLTDPAQLRHEVAAAVAAGYRRVKAKIAPGSERDVVAAARDAAGPTCSIQADANGTYRRSDRARLAMIDDLGLECIEQPLPPDALLDHAAVASTLGTPIALDESITSATRARDAIELGACRAVSIKHGRVGGIAEALLVHDVCVATGTDAFAGGMVETGVGRAVTLTIAALPGCTLTGDCSPSDRWFDDDLTEPFVLHDGHVALPSGPGIGVVPRADRLRACLTAHEALRP